MGEINCLRGNFPLLIWWISFSWWTAGRFFVITSIIPRTTGRCEWHLSWLCQTNKLADLHTPLGYFLFLFLSRCSLHCHPVVCMIFIVISHTSLPNTIFFLCCTQYSSLYYKGNSYPHSSSFSACCCFTALSLSTSVVTLQMLPCHLKKRHKLCIQ